MSSSPSPGRIVCTSLLCGFIAVSTFVVTACGRNSKDATQPPMPPGPPRLAWSQQASSAVALEAYLFMLYVDGSPSQLTEVQCGSASGPAGFACSGGIPTAFPAGRHELRLSASVNGVESGRSDPLFVTFPLPSRSTISLGTDTRSPARVEDRRSATTCARHPYRDCYEVEQLVSGLGEITSLTPTPFGDLLFVEDGRRVRVLTAAGLSRESAFEVDGTESRVLGLAIDVDFVDTHRAFVAVSRPVARNQHALTVMRFREVAGAFGEAVAVVADVAMVPSGAPVPLAIAQDRHLYVALPAFDDRRGAVLRFTRDGGVPRANAGASPVLVSSYDQPSSLGADRAGRLWMAGRRGDWAHRVASLSIATGENLSGWQAQVLADPNSPHNLIHFAIADSTEPAVLMSYERAGYPGGFAADGRLSFKEPLLLRADETITSVAVERAGSLLMASGDASGTFGVARFVRR